MTRSNFFADFGALFFGSVLFLGCSEAGTGTSSGGGGSGGSMETGGADAETGTTSTTGGETIKISYPEPQTDLPRQVWRGGAVLKSPKVLPVYFAGDDPTTTSKLTELSNAVAGSAYWEATTAEYGVGPLAALPPVVLSEAPADMLEDKEIAAWLRAKINADDPQFAGVDEETIVTLYYPGTTTISLDGALSCVAFGGYHNETAPLDDAHGGKPVVYAVIPRCEFPPNLAEADRLTYVTSHEWIEAALDPFPFSDFGWGGVDIEHFYWGIIGSEPADWCSQTASSNFTLPGSDIHVQKSWSNKAAAAGHDPCAPTPPGEVYFNAAAAQTNIFNLADWEGNPSQIHGIRLSKGESKTVSVVLFSDGKMDEPIHVQALGVPLSGAAQSNLKLSWDKNTGMSGETLQLTITGIGDLSAGEALVLFSSVGARDHLWIGYVLS